VCGILRQTTLIQRQTGEHIQTSKRAHALYLAKRIRLTRSINQLRSRVGLSGPFRV
jgi:ABC-type molybdenum transport system ATPase subunit/photorepair protein PhrA